MSVVQELRASHREDAHAKGRRYLIEGRLRITRCDRTGIEATCKGQGHLYNCGYERGRWFCSCPAKSRCSHLIALQLVTVAPPQGGNAA